MDVNDIFKLPALPKSSLGKRKTTAPSSGFAVAAGNANTDAEPGAKAVKLANGSSSRTRVATEEEESEMEQQQAMQVEDDDNSGFAPGDDADYFVEEDAEGRFYGGGLNTQQKEILKILDTDVVDTEDDGAAAAMTLAECRKTLLNLEKTISKNREQRTKFASDPTKFIDSEVALDEALHSILLFTQDPASFYPELVRLNSTSSLVDLLSHENVDIAITVIKILEELTDEDVGDGVEDEEGFLEALTQLVKGLLTVSLLDLLIANMSRLSEAEGAEQQGLYHTYGLIENLLSSAESQDAASALLSTNFLELSLRAILPPKSSNSKGKQPANGNGPMAANEEAGNLAAESNRFYAAEILAILLSLPTEAGEQAKKDFLKKDGIDATLQILSVYRKRDPRGTEEVEFMENIFDLMCQCLGSEDGKRQFREAEGTELMILLMKEKKMARTRSIKVLDFAMSSDGEGAKTCLQFVECLGLKTLFPALMGKSGKKENAPIPEDIEHILGILASLFSALPSDSPERIRLLAKFVSDDYDKIDRLVEVREASVNRIARWESDASARQDADIELSEDDIFLGKLENGLATLQLADFVLAMACVEDDGVREHAKMLFSRNDKTLVDVAQCLDEYGSSIEGAEPAAIKKREQIMDLMQAIFDAA